MSYGMDGADDIYMRSWTGTIIGPHNRSHHLSDSIQESTGRVHHETGAVDPKKFGLLANWQRDYTMENILVQLKKEMVAPQNCKLVQPPEGTFF
uniref:UBC core domain-containing protein n=1 Tax=Oryza punctata TaxID=4537 RepID=A0A0E0JYM5_ORYPU